MTTCLARPVHVLLLFAVVSAAVSSMPARPALAGDVVRYSSAAYGYTLLAPASWVRLSGVRWTPTGSPADLTLMTPDHQAALGVIVAPTGSRHYSNTELQTIALRLLYQENGVIPALPVRQTPLVIHGMTFQTASAPAFSGAVYTYNSKTSINVWVTQRANRVYALVGLVYLWQATLPPPRSGGATATPTPDDGNGMAPNTLPGPSEAIQREQSIPVALPTAGPAAAVRPAQAAADALRPLSTDRLRGNLCPEASDGTLIFRDKNCAARGGLQAITNMVASFDFTTLPTPDRRPAASVGVDGFAIATSSSLGVRVEYPAQWTTFTVANTNLAVRSTDQNTLVTLTVQRSATASVALSDLQSYAASLITQVASGPPPTYQTVQANGVVVLRADAPHAVIIEFSGGIVQAQVNVTVASYRHRVYSLRAVAATYLPSLAANAAPPAVYPFFSPFTTLARSSQSTVDLLVQQSDLAVQTAWSLFVDPHVPDAG